MSNACPECSDYGQQMHCIEYVRSMSKTWPEHVWDMCRICPMTCRKHVRSMCSVCAKNMCSTSSEHVQDMACPRQLQHMFTTCAAHAHKSIRTCSEHVLDMCSIQSIRIFRRNSEHLASSQASKQASKVAQELWGRMGLLSHTGLQLMSGLERTWRRTLVEHRLVRFDPRLAWKI